MASDISTILEPRTAPKVHTSIEEITIAVHRKDDRIHLFERSTGTNGWHLVGEVEKEYLLAANYYAGEKIYRNIQRFYEDIAITRKPGSFRFNGYEIDLIPHQTVPKYIEPFLEASEKIKVRRRVLINTN